MDALPHPVLLADVGGTNARFALCDAPGGPVVAIGRLETGAFDGFGRAAAHVLASRARAPGSAVLCGAGPVVEGSIRLTNAAWHLEPAAIARALSIDPAAVHIVNDFQALAFALPRLRPPDLLAIGEARPRPRGVRLVLGPGTGFGAAALAEVEGRLVALPAECGQMDLGPVTPGEAALWPLIERDQGRISVESLLSGPGLERLDMALQRQAGRDAPRARPASEIASLALSRSDAIAEGAAALFLSILARVAGDLALAFRATGGVYIAGGVAQRLAPLVDAAAFCRAFAAKPPLCDLVEATPLAIIMRDDPAFLGLAAIAAEPGRHLAV